MKSAKEMFDKLGFKQTENDDSFIEYQRDDGDQHAEITFSLKDKTFRAIYGRYEFGMNFHYVTSDELKAIHQQAKELDWVDEKICTNFSSGQTSGFMCSNCGIYLDDLNEIVIDENCKRNVNQDGYELRYCPNCGCKIVDYDNFAKKAKYKVTQFEFDLLNTYKFCSDSCKFEDCTQLREMKMKGYFKDVDKKAKIHDILWNCGVIKCENS